MINCFYFHHRKIQASPKTHSSNLVANQLYAKTLKHNLKTQNISNFSRKKSNYFRNLMKSWKKFNKAKAVKLRWKWVLCPPRLEHNTSNVVLMNSKIQIKSWSRLIRKQTTRLESYSQQQINRINRQPQFKVPKWSQIQYRCLLSYQAVIQTQRLSEHRDTYSHIK